MPPAVMKPRVMECPSGAIINTAQLLALKALAPKTRGSKPRFSSHMSGQYMSRSRGRGLEFAEVRHYQQGDDIRAIDWRVTARSGKAHTRLYIEEREKPVLIFCDQRNSMKFGSRQRFKSVQAANLAALLAWGSLAAGDRVGGIVASASNHLEVRPSLSHKTVAQYLHLVANQSQPIVSEQTNSLEQMLGEVRRISKPGTSIYIISDCSDWTENCDKQLALISRHCNLSLLHISDRLEHELPANGAYPFSDGNTRIVLSGAKQAKQLALHFAQKQQTLRDTCKKYKVGFAAISTEDDAIAAASICLRGQYA